MAALQDLTRLKAFLVNSKLFKDNNALYQTIDGLIIAAQELQRLINANSGALAGLDKVLTYGTESERASFTAPVLPGVLIVFYTTDTQILYGFTGAAWEQIAASAFATYLTSDDESAGLPNSLQLIAGTNITFTDTGGQRIVSASVTAAVSTTGTITTGSIVVFASSNQITSGVLSGEVIGSTNSTLATLSTTGVVAGTYGSTTAVPVITVDTKGRLTTVTTVTITSGSGSGVTTTGTIVTTSLVQFSGTNSITSGDLSGDVTTSDNLVTTLSTTGVTAGNYGSSTAAVIVDVDAKGRITTISTTTITGTGGSSGALVLVEQTSTTANTTQLILTTGFTSTYDNYLLEIINVAPSTNASIILRYSTNSGSTFISTTTYNSAAFRMSSAGSASAGSTVGTSVDLTVGDTCRPTTTDNGLSGNITIYDPLNTGKHKTLTGQTRYVTPAEFNVTGLFSAKLVETNPINALQISTTTGSIANGIIRLYGIAKS